MKEKLLKGQEKLSLVGLGYVGMPIAVAFANEGVKRWATSLTISLN